MRYIRFREMSDPPTRRTVPQFRVATLLFLTTISGLLLGLLARAVWPDGQTSRLNGQPHWFPLGNEVYHASEVQEAQRTTLRFIEEPRWFKTDMPYPKKLEDVPTQMDGAQLRLDVRPTNEASTLNFLVALTSDRRPLVRQFEHRWNNVLPLLFALYVDGEAVRLANFIPNGLGRLGGAGWSDIIIKRGASKTWRIRVDAESICRLLPDDQAHLVSIVVAFSEFQHEFSGQGESGHSSWVRIVAEGSEFVPRAVVRSNVVEIHWTGDSWSCVDAAE